MVAPGQGLSPNGQHEAAGACGAFCGELDQHHDINAKLSQYIQSTGHWQASLERELGLEGGMGPHPAVLRHLVSSSLQHLNNLDGAIYSLESSLAVGSAGASLHLGDNSAVPASPGLHTTAPDAAPRERCMRTELFKRCLLTMLYQQQISARAQPTSEEPLASSLEHTSTITKAISNCRRAVELSAVLGDFETLTYCTVAEVELHVGAKDLAAAAAAFDSCVVAVTAGVMDPQLRARLLQRVLPMSMEILNMQGLTFEAFSRFRTLNLLLAATGRSVVEECPICTEEFTPNRACVSLCCGHSFHKSCCDRWLGHKMLMAGRFRAECPVCKQVDAGLKPTPTALQALSEPR